MQLIIDGSVEAINSNLVAISLQLRKIIEILQGIKEQPNTDETTSPL